MPASNYSVETRKQGVLLVGAPSPLFNLILQKIEGRGIRVFLHEIEVTEEYDLDYCLALDSPAPENFLGLRVVELQSIERASAHHPRGGIYTTLFYPELVGEGVSPSASLLSLVKSVLSTKKIVVAGEGLAKHYLLHQEDLINYALELLFHTSSSGQVFLADPDSPSELSFAYLLRSQIPQPIEIVMGGDFPAGSQSRWEPVSYSLRYKTLDYLPPLIATALTLVPALRPPPKPEKHLQPLAKKLEEPVFVPVRTKPHNPPHKITRLTGRWKIMLNGLFIGLGLYLTSLVFATTLTYLSGRRILNSFNSSSLPGTSFLTLADKSAHYLEVNLVALSSLPGLKSSPKLNSLLSLFSLYREGLVAGGTIHKLSYLGKDLVSYILGGEELDANSLLEQAKLETSTLYEQLSLLEGGMGDQIPVVIPERYEQDYQKFRQAVSEGRRAALSGKSMLAVAPDLLGLGGRRKYLVLFQNNMELRATGGFIGSFAILSFENGHLYDMPIYDVYSADGQLKGHVEPPKEIKDILGEAKWYLRDSNWDPDFNVSSRRAEWFLKKTLGIEVQGTIGVNIYSLSGILRALGGVEIPDYNETITADNIFERAEYHSEANFFPGSTGKKEILSSIASSVFNSLHSLSLNQTLGVIRALAEGIDNRHTMISVASPATSRVFHTLGWDGGVRDPDCPKLGEGDCLSDYAFLVESNFGVNKANYFLERKLSDTINLSGEGRVTHELQISYTNRATSLSWPAGNYKNYLRLYLPPSTNVSAVMLDDRILGPERYSVYAEHGKTVLGLLVEVPINSTVNLSLSYSLGGTLDSSSATYSYYWQKQSGTGNDPLSIKINYPGSFQPELISPRATLEDGSLGFGLVSNTDRRITVKFK